MQPILLATDLTPWCDRAKERALWLARRDGARLCVLHVTRDADQPTAKAGDEIAAMLADEAAGIDSDVRIVAGEPWEEISAAAHRIDAGLVVLGRHRHEALRDFFLSPTASKVRAVPPVLQAVNLHVGPWRRAVVGSDFSPLAQRALEVAVGLAREADLHLVHTFEMPFAGFITNQVDTEAITGQNRTALNEAGRQAVVAAGAEGRNVALGLARGAVVPTLVAEVARLDADLLVIGAGGGGGKDFGSTARALTVDPPCDLLVVPDLKS